MILFLKILGGIAALALGIFLGFGRCTQSQEEIEVRMGGGKPRRAQRHFMWLNYFRTQERSSVRGRPRPRFKTVVASDKTVVARDRERPGPNPK